MSSPVKVLAVIEERKYVRKSKISIFMWIFRNGKPDRDDDRRMFLQ